MSKGFSFKQFHVAQEKAAFKVGTDSVLLGAWVNISSAKNILDIGTGTGLLALMCAQRNPSAHIVGIEKDALSAEDALHNMRHSPWKERMDVQQLSLEAFKPDLPFDFILCNPPYFLSALPAATERKTNARHTDKAWFALLANKLNDFSTEDAIFACVLPEPEFLVVADCLKEEAWFLQRKLEVFPFPGGGKKRILAEFGKKQILPSIEPAICVRNADRAFSNEYIALTADFYLHF